MKKYLIPAGEVLYLGTDTELADIFHSMYGTVEADRKFRCYVYVPGKKRDSGASPVIRRGNLSFFFRGHFAPTGEAYKISYKVYPGSAALLFAVPAYLLARAFFEHPDALKSNLIAFGILSAIVVLLYFLARHFAIRQFVKTLEEDEETEEIFD